MNKIADHYTVADVLNEIKKYRPKAMARDVYSLINIGVLDTVTIGRSKLILHNSLVFLLNLLMKKS